MYVEMINFLCPGTNTGHKYMMLALPAYNSPCCWYLDTLYPFHSRKQMYTNSQNLMPLDRFANDIHVIIKTSGPCQRPRCLNQQNIARKRIMSLS